MVAEPAIAGRAVDVLVILDGASEPLGDAPTSLERARTPVLDRLASQGALSAVRTVGRGLPVGSETAIPALLGWVPDRPVDRAAVEAAAYGIEVAEGERAWRVDRCDRADASSTAGALAARLAAHRSTADHRVHHLAGHRMLLVAPARAHTLGAELLEIELRSGTLGVGGPGRELFVWPRGAIPPRTLAASTVLVGARGAAIGVARLMGARTVVPPGATGRPGSDLAGKAVQALRAIDDGAGRVVVHVGAPDEAAHERDAEAKAAAIAAADSQLLAPLADALRARGGTLRVCPDHGCDPRTGEHHGAPVPCLAWAATRTRGHSREGTRLTERAVAGLAVTDLVSVESSPIELTSGAQRRRAAA